MIRKSYSLQQTGIPLHRERELYHGFDSPIELRRSQDKFYKDCIALGLLCMRLDPLLVENFVDYCMFWYEPEMAVCEWVVTGVENLASLSVKHKYKQEFFTLSQYADIERLTSSIQLLFPRRKQSSWHTFVSLRLCTELMDMENGDDLDDNFGENGISIDDRYPDSRIINLLKTLYEEYYSFSEIGRCLSEESYDLYWQARNFVPIVLARN